MIGISLYNLICDKGKVRLEVKSYYYHGACAAPTAVSQWAWKVERRNMTKLIMHHITYSFATAHYYNQTQYPVLPTYTTYFYKPQSCVC